MLWGKEKPFQGCVSESWESLEAYAREQNIDFQPFEEITKPVLPAPVCLAGKEVEAIAPFVSMTKSVLLRFVGKGAYFAHGHLIDAQDRVIYHPEMLFAQLPIRHQVRPRKIHTLKGTIAYLSNTATAHYGHWLRLTLPMLRLYERQARLDTIDYFYVGDVEITPFMRESFALLGIPTEKIVNFPCTSEQIMMASNRWILQNGYRYLDVGSYDFICQRVGKAVENFLPACKDCYPRLAYIARGKVNWRKVVNETEVIAVLEKYGIEYRAMDSLSMLEQMRIFQQAEVIIAPHGAALTNLFFAKPHTKVLEILPETYHDHTTYHIAAYSHCDYYYMRAKITPNQASVAPEYQDMWIDVAVLEECLDKII
ncbi:MAG: glycosyltransferase family 61 protein [Bacteroidetes bacterium]|nr:MAG: glycosyltransferase family 61 protein [Bacteroidota bacterium]